MEFHPLEPDAVVSYKGKGQFNLPPQFIVEDFKKYLRRGMGATVDNFDPWFEDGMPCKVLRPGHGWQKGRLRIRLIEFCPDESVTIDE